MYNVRPYLRAYRDVCLRILIVNVWSERMGRHHPVRHETNTFVDHVCPEDTICKSRKENMLDTIICEPIVEKDEDEGEGKWQGYLDDNKNETRESEPKGLSSSSPATKNTHAGRTQYHQTVTINRDMPGASASAFVKSECRIVNVHFLKYISLLMSGIN